MSRRLPARKRDASAPRLRISIAVALALIGFVAAAQWNSSLGRQQFISSAQGVLVREAEQLQRQQEQLRAELQEAEARVRSLQESGAGSQTALDMLNQQLTAARIAAGVVPLRGPGVVIEIADSEREVPPGESATNYIVLVDDVRHIVTALWAAGAEAITITGSLTVGAPSERLVSDTSIYGSGVAIQVNTTPLSPPYRIEAIGPDGLHERFLAHPAYTRVAHRIDAYGLRFDSQPRDELTLPGFIGDTRLRWGVPLEEPT